MYDLPSASNQDYKKQEEAMKKMVESAAKKSPTSILKEKSKQLNAKEDPERMRMCEMLRMLFHEGLDQYEKGKLSLDDFVEDLHRSMAAIGRAKMKDK